VGHRLLRRSQFDRYAWRDGDASYAISGSKTPAISGSKTPLTRQIAPAVQSRVTSGDGSATRLPPPTAKSTAPSAAKTTATGDQPDDEEKYNRADGGIDDQADRSAAKVNA